MDWSACQKKRKFSALAQPSRGLPGQEIPTLANPQESARIPHDFPPLFHQWRCLASTGTLLHSVRIPESRASRLAAHAYWDLPWSGSSGWPLKEVCGVRVNQGLSIVECVALLLGYLRILGVSEHVVSSNAFVHIPYLLLTLPTLCLTSPPSTISLTMASLTLPILPKISPYVQAETIRKTISQLPQYGSFDDFAAMAVVTTLTLLWLLRGVVWDRPDPYLYKMYERPQEKTGTVKKDVETRDIRVKLDKIGADIVIFWGSQSGTAERIANRLSKEISQRFGKKALPADCSDYEPESMKNLKDDKFALFIASTFGEGEPSDNINDLWTWLHSTKGLPLANLKYAAFGLGNSNYKYYNAVIDYVAERLDTLGGQALLAVGRADDAKGETEEHYLDWKQKVFNLFTCQMGFEEHDPVYEQSINVVEDAEIVPEDLHVGQVFEQAKNKFTARKISPVHAVAIKEVRKLFDKTDDGRNCIHMELDLNDHPGLRYKTGDHLGIWPVNPTAEVDRLLNLLGRTADRDRPVSVSPLQQGEKLKIPSPTTLGALLGNYLETCAPVSRETIASLVQFAPNDAAKTHLTQLSKDKKAHQQLLESKYINFGRLLGLVANDTGVWRSLPLSFVIESLPAMQPRWYSISSSSVVSARQVAITTVVNDNAISGSNERIPGLCTNYLLAAKNNFTGDRASARTYLLRSAQLKWHNTRSAPQIDLQAPSQRNATDHYGCCGHRHCTFSRLSAGASKAEEDGSSSRQDNPILWLPQAAA